MKIDDNPYIDIPKPENLVRISDDFRVNLSMKGYEDGEKVTQETLEALYVVRSNLGNGEDIEIFSAYRSSEHLYDLWKRRLDDVVTKFPNWNEETQIKFASRFTASPTHQGFPPHSRGDAVDVRLIIDNKPATLTQDVSDYEQMKYNYFEDLDFKIHGNRKRLRSLMESGGFIPYDEEYWHFGLTPVFLSEVRE